MKKHLNSGIYVKTGLAAMALSLLFALPALAAKPIDVCYTSDFSGVNANVGITQTKVVEMFIKSLNAAGGVKGRPINLIIQDNGSDPSKAVGIAKMFKDQYKCKVVLVDVTSSVCLALKNFADSNKLPMVAASPQSEKLTVLNQKAWFFRTSANAALYAHTAMARLKKLGHTKIAFDGTALAWGTDTLATVKEVSGQYGIQLVYINLTEPKTKDLSIQVKKMMDSGASAILCAEYEAEASVLARAISGLGWKPYVINTSASNVASALAITDHTLLEGWEAVTIADDSKPSVRKVWTQANAYTGGNPPIDQDEKAIRAYDQVAVLVEALKVAKNLDDSTSIRDALYNINPNWEWVSGKLGSKGGFTTAKNHLLNVQDMVILNVRNGKMVSVK